MTLKGYHQALAFGIFTSFTFVSVAAYHASKPGEGPVRHSVDGVDD